MRLHESLEHITEFDEIAGTRLDLVEAVVERQAHRVTAALVAPAIARVVDQHVSHRHGRHSQEVATIRRPQRAASVHEVFAAVCELPAAVRDEALKRLCGDDHALRGEVEVLLAVDSGRRASGLRRERLRIMGSATRVA